MKNINAAFGKVFKRNLAIVLIAVILFTSIFVILYIANGNNALERQISQIEQQNLTDTSTGAEYTFNQISDICNFYSSIELIELNEPYSETSYLSFLAMKKQVDVATAFLDIIEGISIQRGKSAYIIGIASTDNIPKKDESTELGKIGNASLYITDTMDKYGDRSIYFNYTAPNANTVNVLLDSYQLSRLIFSGNDTMRTEYIVDSKGDVIFSQKSSSYNHNLKDLYGFEFKEFSDSTKKIIDNKKEAFVTVKKLKNLELYAVSVAQQSAYNNYFSQANTTNLLLTLLFVVLACVVGFIILTATYRPIRKISNEINKYAPSIDLYNKDEVMFITDVTKQLYFENRELNTFVYEKANEIRRNQIKMLQTQICPHFVCNTLDAMNWLAYRYIKSAENPLANTIQNMSLILENNLDLSTMFTTVGEEIKITERYIDIINVRYENAFDIVWDIDDSVRDCVIMKLCIQPLIENASSYAFNKISHRGLIKISVKEQGADILVRVEDNGVGMKKAYLEELIKSINDFELINSSKNIGMRNINHRLLLLYGDEYKLEIESAINKGTICSFRIPRQNNE